MLVITDIISLIKHEQVDNIEHQLVPCNIPGWAWHKRRSKWSLRAWDLELEKSGSTSWSVTLLSNLGQA